MKSDNKNSKLLQLAKEILDFKSQYLAKISELKNKLKVRNDQGDTLEVEKDQYNNRIKSIIMNR